MYSCSIHENNVTVDHSEESETTTVSMIYKMLILTRFLMLGNIFMIETIFKTFVRFNLDIERILCGPTR